MFKVAIGQGEDIDTRSAVDTALAHCQSQLKGLRPQAGIVFSSIDFDHELVLAEVLRRFPGIELVGCTTGGEFSSNFGFSDDSVNVILFCADTVSIRAGVGRLASVDPALAAESALQQARAGQSGPEKLCIVFPEGIVASPEAVVQTLNRMLAPECPVFGGVPSRHYEIPAPTLQFFGDEVLEDAVPLLLFSGRLRYEFSISNSWRPIGRKATITAAHDYEIRRIGDKRALDFYRYYLGAHRYPALEFPLAVYDQSDGARFFIRSPGDYDENRGSIFFSGSIAPGTTVQLTEVTRERILADTRASLLTPERPDHRDWQPAVALAFSCATRKQMLGTRTPEELEILAKLLPPRLPICGFYTFGELAPLQPGEVSRLHNCTLVALLLGEEHSAGGAAPADTGTAPPPPTLQRSGETPPEQLHRDNLFLLKKLKRSEHYRERLERNKDLSDALLKKINRDMKRAHREIKRKNRLLRKSLALANEIQLNLLPQQDPFDEYLDIAGKIIYSSATGGDYYDYIRFPQSDGQRLDVVVGDVTGHGIEAALLMTTARAFLRARIFQPGSLGQVVTDVNRQLTADLYETGRFMTLFYMALDPPAGRLSWVRAGHDPAILFDPATGHLAELRGPGIALGVDRNWHYEEKHRTGLAAGQIIFIGTDGIWETRGPRGDMFGKKRVHDLIRTHAGTDAAAIAARITEDLDRFRESPEPEDDITLVVIKVKDRPVEKTDT
ncbi:MAG: SpoIIE family protein phosphatase [Desulfobacterales bacterium]